MAFHITHLYGAMEGDPSLDQLADLLSELDMADGEHTDVSVTHESEWCLSVFPNGGVVWENLEGSEPPRHMVGLTKEKILDLWTKLAQGEIARIDSEPWLEGYY